MKSFYIIIGLFAIMLVAMCGNYYYIESFSSDAASICEEIATLPREISSGKIKALQEKWEKSKKFIQITVNHTEIEMINNALDELLAYAEHGASADFEKARRFAVNAFEELLLSEQLSPTNIL